MFREKMLMLFLVGLESLLAGCGVSHLGTINAVAVNVVDETNQNELHPAVKNPHYLTELLRLEFSSPVDFFVLSRRYQYHLGVIIRWCKDGDRGRDIRDGLPYFYMGASEVQGSIDRVSAPNPMITTKDGKEYIYHAYFHVKQIDEIENSAPAENLPPYPPYDLTVNPQDLCLWVRGGNMIGFHGVSNKAVFSKEMIEDALKHYQHP